MATPLRVLIVEDSPDDAALAAHELQKGGFEPIYRRVETREDMLRALDADPWDFVLSDYYMPQFDALQALATLHSAGLDLPFILMSGSVGEETAVEAMRAGIHDYVFKHNLSRLCAVVERELKEARIREERRQAREALHQSYAELERRVEERTEELRLANARLSHEIEERTQAAQALARSQERLNLAQQAANLGLFEWDIVTGKVYWTPELEAVFGLTAGGFGGAFENWSSRVYPDDLASVTAFINDWLASDRPNATWEYRFIHTSGEVRWIEARARILRGPNGTPLCMVGSNLDITERKRAEEALRVSEEHERTNARQLQAVLDAAPGAIFIADDPECRIIHGNRGSYELLRKPVGVNLSKSAPEDERPTTWQEMKDGQPIPTEQLPMQLAGRGEEVRDYEMDIVFDDGRVKSVLANATALRDVDGRITGVVAALADITARKRAEETLAENREQLQLALESLGGGFWDNHITHFNPETLDRTYSSYFADAGLQKLLGLESEEFSPELWKQLVHPEDCGRVGQEVTDCLRGACASLNTDFRVIRPDGQEIWVAARGQVIRDETGMPIRWTGVAWDITERKQAEEELKRAHDELEQRVVERTINLAEVNRLLVQEVETRSHMEQQLRDASRQLEQERVALERKNIAMRELLDQVRAEKERLRQQLTTNLQQTVSPTLQKLKMVRSADVHKLVDILEHDLRDAASPFLTSLKNRFTSLSPRELEICRFIRNGQSTKEIAEGLSLSPMTVQKHREVIRKKLGLNNEEVNLQSFLQQFTEQD